MGTNTIVNDEAQLRVVLNCARGRFQRNLLNGYESLSLSTLRGRAATYRGRYRESCNNLIARIRAVGVTISETRGAHGKRILVIG